MKVVFACKSNSCRSQMAEGWAHEWVKKHQKTTSEEKQFLDTIIVASVALDSSSVFNKSNVDVVDDSKTAASQKQEQQRQHQHQQQRKPVKAKAVEAMAAYGVDISKCSPKTLDELLPTFLSCKNTSSEGPDMEWSTMEITNSNETDASRQKEDGNEKPLDKLIVMYSCAKDVQHHVASRSQQVIQWDIEAPTAAAKAGEGNAAYQRVSLEIRAQVEALLEELLHMSSAECSEALPEITIQ